MPTMLRHKETGEVWPYNRNLAMHGDVEPFDTPDPQFAAAAKAGATLGDVQEAAAEEKVEAQVTETASVTATTTKAEAKKDTKPRSKATKPKPKPAAAAAKADDTQKSTVADDALDDLDLDD